MPLKSNIKRFLVSRLLVPGFCFFSTYSYSQFYESGQEPASLHWNQINTTHAQIIFPKGSDSIANRLANIYEFNYKEASQSLDISPRNISVVLHTQSSYSNGFVTLGPRRMELYTTPPQDLIAIDWLSDLAVHEFRHVAQTGKINQGITRLYYPLFGQLSTGMVSAAMPMWFVEGDAVYTETMLTNAGRGRSGNFTMALKPLIAEQNNLISFEKSLYGSYKHFVPDHYHTGYFMVSAISKKYGHNVFKNSISHTAQYPFIPFSFSHNLKLETGKTARELYKETFNGIIKQVIDTLKTTLAYPLFSSQKNNDIISYNYPQKVNENTIIAVKSGLGYINQFVLIYNNGREETIYTPGNYNNTRFSYSNGKIAWSEEIPDLRWSNRSYSCIKLYDIATKKMKRLTHKTKYYAAAQSKDGNNIATVEITPESKVYIVVLNAQTGEIIQRQPSTQNLTLSDPVFSYNDSAILVISSGLEGKAIFRISTISGLWEQITPFTFHNISCPGETENYIFYSADYTGTNNIYAFKKANKTLFQLTKTKYGAFEPYIKPNDSLLYFADYGLTGYRTKYVSFNEPLWKKTQFPEIYSDSVINAGSRIENFNFQDSLLTYKEILSQKHEIKRYSKLSHLINIHSWSPFYYDYNNLSLDNQEIYPGMTLLSQNKLSTCVSSLSYFNAYGTWYLKPRVIYKGWYPVIDISADYGGPVNFLNGKNSYRSDTIKYISINSLIYIPFNLTRSKFISGIYPLIELNYDNTRLFNPSNSNFNNGRTFITLGFNSYSYLKTSERDIYPHLGFSLNVRYKYTPFDKVQYGYIAYIKPRIYLPGILPHHSLQFSGAYQQQDPRIRPYYSLIPFARGYSNNYLTYKLITLSVDYSFPIFYPDFNIGPLAYFKRLRTNLFYDLAGNHYKVTNNNKTTTVNHNFSSIGADLITDFHAMHIFFPFYAGLRTVYLPNENVTLNQFFVGLDFKF
jgi:hypothetical protein